MAIDERERHRLFERLDEVLGPEEAATLMGHLPPVGWGDVVRRSDLDGATAALRSDIESLRGDLESLRGDLETSVAGLRGELDSAVAVLRSEFRASLHEEIGGVRSDLLSMQRQLVFAIIASQFTAVSLAFAAAAL